MVYIQSKYILNAPGESNMWIKTGEKSSQHSKPRNYSTIDHYGPQPFNLIHQKQRQNKIQDCSLEYTAYILKSNSTVQVSLLVIIS